MSDFSAGSVTIPIRGADPAKARSMVAPSSDIAFTPAIKAIQAARIARCLCKDGGAWGLSYRNY